MTDNHTHNLRPHSVVNIDPSVFRQRELGLRRGYLYSVGIHPWNALRASMSDIRAVKALAVDPRVVAIGETGLDSIHAGCQKDMEAQTELLDYHIFLSEYLCKPLLLHIVRRYPDIIRLKNRLRSVQPWVIHGFRGKPELADELVRAGFYLSYGERFNPASVAVTPPDRLLVETDESSLPVGIVARRLGVIPKVTLPALCAASQSIAPKT